MKVVRRQQSTVAAILVAAAFGFSTLFAPLAFAAVVDVEQGKALVPAGSLDTNEAAADAAVNAGAATAAKAAMTVNIPANASASGGRTGVATAQSAANTTASAPQEAASQSKTSDVDLRRTVRDVAKPVLDDLAHSAVVDAVRGLNGAGQAADGDDPTDADAGAEAAGRRRNWDGQQTAQDGDGGNSRRARSDADMANDKVKATFLFQALVEEVAPWAIAAAIFYALFYVARLIWAVRRRVKAEKRERRRLNDRRRSSSTSRGSPTQR